MLSKILRVFVVLFIGFFSYMVSASAADIVAVVNVQKQMMTVKKNGQIVYNWKVSTGRKGYTTPSGIYRPQRMHKMWYSRKYDNAPMPYAIFYNQGYAIHGTNATGRLGSPASHGCVRLNTANAKTLYGMVQHAGAQNLKIVITH